MKRCILAFIIVLLAVFPFTGICSEAEEISSGNYAEDFGIDADFTDEVMGGETEAAQFLRENGITADNPDGITSLSPKTVFAYMIQKLKNSAAEPLRIFGMMIAVIILTASAAALSDSLGEDSSADVCRIISVLAAVAVISSPIERCIANVSDSIGSGGDFMLCYVPVFASVAAASGSVTSAASYNAAVIIAAKAAVELISAVLIPAVSICMAMGIVSSITQTVKLSGIISLLKKWASLILGFIMTVFTGLLSIQSVVGASADNLAAKAAKFVVSNCIPIVGSAVADAYSTVRTGLGMLRGAAGAFGVIAFVLIILPPIIETGCMYLAMTAAQAIADIFGVGELSSLFSNAASVLSILTALLACFAVMFCVSTFILMAAGLGASGIS